MDFLLLFAVFKSAIGPYLLFKKQIVYSPSLFKGYDSKAMSIENKYALIFLSKINYLISNSLTHVTSQS